MAITAKEQIQLNELLKEQESIQKRLADGVNIRQKTADRYLIVEEKIAKLLDKQRKLSGDELDIQNRAAKLSKSIGETLKKNAVQSEKILSFGTKSLNLANVFKQRRTEILQNEQSLTDIIKEAADSSKIDNDLKNQSLEILEQLQLGNLDANELASLRLQTADDMTDAEKNLVNAINKRVNAEEEFVKSEDKALELSKKIEAKFSKIKGIITATAAIGFLTGVAKKFGETLDKIGQTFGSLSVMGEPFKKDLMDASIEATRLGGGIEDVSAITNTLASNFGINVDEAAKLSSKVFDTSKAIGLSADEGANLFGVLTQTANLSANQAEKLAEGAFQLARQRGVAPNAVLKDLAQSAEAIAEFTKDGGDNIAEAAVQARILGVSLDTTAKISKGLLDFESSINNEIEASVMIGKQLNFQRARQLALEGDIAGATKDVVAQLGSEAEFNKLNVLQRESLAKSIGVSVSELSKLVGQSDKLSLSGAMAAGNFEDLLGEEGLSNISQLIGQFKAFGATLVNELGPTIETLIGQFKNFIEKGGGVEKITGAIQLMAGGISTILNNIPALIAGFAAFKTVQAGLALAAIFPALAKSATFGGAVGVLATVAAITTGFMALKAMIPAAQTGISGFSGGLLQVGESGPEIMNVPRGTSVMSAEQTRQTLSGGSQVDINPLIEATKETTRAISNLNITAGRGEIRVAMEPQMGGNL